jgi:hypothetical protein
VDPKAIETKAEGEPARHPSLSEAFFQLRQLCSEEGFTFEQPSRINRPNPFADDESLAASD